MGQDLLDIYKASESDDNIRSTIRNSALRSRLLAAQPAPSGAFDERALTSTVLDASKKFEGKDLADGIVCVHTSIPVSRLQYYFFLYLTVIADILHVPGYRTEGGHRSD